MLAAAVLFAIYPGETYQVVLFLLTLSLLLHGIHQLIYYFSLCRYKTGSIETLYKGIFFMDAGLFALNINMGRAPRIMGILYLIITVFVSGVVDVLRANEARKLEMGRWKYQFFYGALQIVISCTGLFFLNSVRLMTYIYCLGLINTAISRIITAFRKTAIVYVE